MAYRFFAVVQVEFVGGALEGLQAEQRCGYPSREGALEHLAAMPVGRVVEKPVSGGSPYKVIGGEVAHA